MPGLTQIRYTQTFTSQAGVSWTIDIIDKQYLGESAPFNSDSSGFVLNYISGAERYEAIKASEVIINFLVETSAQETFIDDIVSNDEVRFLVQIKKGSTFYWAGVLLTDLVEIEDAAKPFYVQLKFSCGLGRLAKLPYTKTDGVFYSGDEKLNVIIANILNKTGVEGFWGATETFIVSTIDWIEYNQSNLSTQRLDMMRLQQETFYIQATSKREPIDCLTVLESILLCFFARIYQVDGKWVIDQVNEITKDNAYTTYTKSGDFITGGTNSRSFANTNFKRFSGLFSFFKPLRSATTVYNYKTGSGSNFLPYLSSYEYEIYIGNIYGFTSGVKPVLQFRGFLIHSLQGSGEPSDFRAAFKLRLKLKNPVTGAYIYLYNGDDGNSAFTWQSSPKYVTIYSELKSGSGWFSIDTYWDLITPVIAYEYEMYFKFEFLKFVDEYGNDYTMPAGLTYIWSSNGFTLTAYDPSGANNNVSGEHKFTAYQIATGHYTTNLTANVDITPVIVGDGPLPFNAGALQVANISTPDTFEPASKWWYASINADGVNIAELRLLEFMIGQLLPQLIYRGGLKHITTSIMQPHQYTVVDGQKMIVSGLQLNAGSDEADVELFQCDVDRDDYTNIEIPGVEISGTDSEYSSTFEYNFPITLP